MKNYLVVDTKTFRYHIKTFKVGMERKNAKKKRTIPSAMLTFNNGMLTIEGDEKLVVMHAEGEWDGKARFSFNTLKALALVPPNMNPIIVKYNDGKLSIGEVTTDCSWEAFSQSLIDVSTNPSYIDVIAMWRTHPTEALLGNDILRLNKDAQVKLEKATASAAKRLADFDVTQEELLGLIESKIQSKIEKFSG